MKIKPYIDKLEKSKEYKDFKKEHDKAFLMAGFFVLDFEMSKHVHQIDFYVPGQKKVAAFTLDGGVKLQMLEAVNDKIPAKLDINTNVDLDALHGILEDEMKNRNMTEDVKKIIAVLQNIDGKKLWSLNCVLSGMEILRAHVDDDSRSVLKMEKFSMMDLIKKVPGGKLAGLQKKGDNMTKEEAKVELNKLEKIEKEIAKEKEELNKQMKSKDKISEKAKEKAKIT